MNTGSMSTDGTGIETIGREERRYPEMLRQAPAPPRRLYVVGGADRLQALLRAPAVAIVGTRRASDYGMETARGLARGLAASGVTVVSGLAEGIAAAAHMGALEVERGATVTVMPGGLDVCHPASRRSLYEHIRTAGCAISEHPRGTQVHLWSHMRRMRIVVGLAQLVIVVEAENRSPALQDAHLAEKLGRVVGAVPGRVSSPLSQGTHELLAAGARLIRDPQDTLDALHGVGAPHAPPREPAPGDEALEQSSREVLDEIGAGRDTLTKLTSARRSAEDAAVTLAELELAGAVVRGDGGRYLPAGSHSMAAGANPPSRGSLHCLYSYAPARM